MDVVKTAGPARLIAEAEYVKVGRHRVLMCRCDDGVGYTLTELAALKGLDPCTITKRAKKEGWLAADLLRPTTNEMGGMARGLISGERVDIGLEDIDLVRGVAR
jgi:hypothetical protein